MSLRDGEEVEWGNVIWRTVHFLIEGNVIFLAGSMPARCVNDAKLFSPQIDAKF